MVGSSPFPLFLGVYGWNADANVLYSLPHVREELERHARVEGPADRAGTEV